MALREANRGTFSGSVGRGKPEEKKDPDLVRWQRKQNEKPVVDPFGSEPIPRYQQQTHNIPKRQQRVGAAPNRSGPNPGGTTPLGPDAGKVTMVANSPKQRLSTLATVLEKRQEKIAKNREAEIIKIQEASHRAQVAESVSLTIRSGFCSSDVISPSKPATARQGSPPKSRVRLQDLEGFSLLDVTIDAVVQRMGVVDPLATLKERFEQVAHHVGTYFAHDDLLHSMRTLAMSKPVPRTLYAVDLRAMEEDAAKEGESDPSNPVAFDQSLVALCTVLSTMYNHNRLSHKDPQVKDYVRGVASQLLRYLLDTKEGFESLTGRKSTTAVEDDSHSEEEDPRSGSGTVFPSPSGSSVPLLMHGRSPGQQPAGLGRIPFEDFVEQILRASPSEKRDLDGASDSIAADSIEGILLQHASSALVPRCMPSLEEHKALVHDLSKQVGEAEDVRKHELKAHDQIVWYWKRYSLKRVFRAWRTTVIKDRDDRKNAEMRTLKEKSAAQLQELVEEKIRKIDNLEARVASLRFQNNQDRHDFQIILDGEREAQRKVSNDLNRVQNELEAAEMKILQTQAKLNVVSSELERTHKARLEDRQTYEEMLQAARNNSDGSGVRKAGGAKSNKREAKKGVSPETGGEKATAQDDGSPQGDAEDQSALEKKEMLLESMVEIFEDLCDSIAPTIPSSTIQSQNAAMIWSRVYEAAVATRDKNLGASSNDKVPLSFVDLCQNERLSKFSYDTEPLKRSDKRCELAWPEFEAGSLPDSAEMFLASSVAFCTTPPNPTICIKRHEDPKVAELRDRAIDAWSRARQMDMVRLHTGFEIVVQLITEPEGRGAISFAASSFETSMEASARERRGAPWQTKA